MKLLIVIAIVSVLLSGCVGKVGRTSGVHYGMSKQEVIAVMGDPVSVNTHGNSQFLSYSVCDTDNQTRNGIMRPYVVRLIDGRVDSYGITADISSPQTPVSSPQTPMGRHESEQIVKPDVRAKEPGDLYTELIKLKELKDAGVITDEEFRFYKKRSMEKR